MKSAIITRRNFFKGTVAIGMGAALTLQTAIAAPAEQLPLPLSYKGMFEDIINICARHCGTTPERAVSSSREQREVRTRQLAMYISRRLSGRSFPEIGRRIGGRDHTTVLHADRKISALIKSDPFERRTVETLTDACLQTARLRIAAGVPCGRYL